MFAFSKLKPTLIAWIAAAGFLLGPLQAADPKIERASHRSENATISRQSDTAEPRTLPRDEKADPEDTGLQGQRMEYKPNWPDPPQTGAVLAKMAVGTVFVLGLCVVSLYFARPWLKRMQVSGSPNSSFVLEGSLSVGNRAVLHLVRVGDIRLVAGTDATGLKSLISLPASFKDVLEEQLPAAEPVVPAAAVAPMISPFEVRIPNRTFVKE